MMLYVEKNVQDEVVDIVLKTMRRMENIAQGGPVGALIAHQIEAGKAVAMLANSLAVKPALLFFDHFEDVELPEEVKLDESVSE